VNKYFSTLGTYLVNNNPSFNSSNDYRSYCKLSIKDSIFRAPVTKSELFSLIHKLNKSKAPGNDNIGPELVQTVASVVIDPFLHICNLSFLNGIVSEKLKIAKVIPVFKKGDRSISSNYRPISLLSIFEKLL